ncbi:MAG: hypothetical protein JWR26_4603 [Pedosphaera sp.]|nr:hypothetical protein [Pedosphaera sp.]
MSDTFRHLTPGAPITPIAPAAAQEPEPIRFTPIQQAAAPAPAPAPAPVAPAPVETKFVIAGFPELSAAWPDELRNDLKQHNFTKSVVLLPMGVVEAAIKQGKVSFTWQTMRAWVKPQLPPDAASAHDALVLDLPLKVIIPLFLAEIKGLKPQKKFVIEDDEEPDVFSATRAPEAAPAPAAAVPAPAAPAVRAAPSAPVFTVRPPPPTPAPSSAPAPAAEAHKSPDTNYFVWKEAEEEAVEDTALFVKKGGAPGTAFLNRYATPNQIVEKAASLEGVDGTLIALPDGLLVASRIPPTMNADTIAAFLPQIFGRVSQCTRELRLGDLNNLNFTVGNIPWKIFKVGSIYFAAFGRPGEPLPSAKLAVIAAELDRKAK